jgi:hypothetical protein
MKTQYLQPDKARHINPRFLRMIQSVLTKTQESQERIYPIFFLMLPISNLLKKGLKIKDLRTMERSIYLEKQIITITDR